MENTLEKDLSKMVSEISFLIEDSQVIKPETEKEDIKKGYISLGEPIRSALHYWG